MTICDFFGSISSKYYNYLTKVFSYRLKMAETGLTDILVFHLSDFCVLNGLNNISIYTTGWATENMYGNDLDLFVERSDGKYTWYALQAKVMSFNGAYKDIITGPVPNQWDKLALHETKFGSKSFYLLYNGQSAIKPNKKKPTRNDCLGFPSIDQYGLGLVESKTMKNERLSKSKGWLYFNELFPDHMVCLRKLICCPDSFITHSTAYNRVDIQTGPPYIPVLIDGASQFSEQNANDEIKETDNVKTVLLNKEGLANTRIIISKPPPPLSFQQQIIN